jgi:hypothetical protein
VLNRAAASSTPPLCSTPPRPPASSPPTTTANAADRLTTHIAPIPAAELVLESTTPAAARPPGQPADRGADPRDRILLGGDLTASGGDLTARDDRVQRLQSAASRRKVRPTTRGSAG